MKETFSFFEKNRRRITAVFAVFAVGVILLTRHSWEEGSVVGIAFISSGVGLIFLGIMGRLWSTMYIGGRKNEALVQDGPYSMCRNPLYFSSFLAGLGATLLFENVILTALYAVMFSFYYPNVIKSEERRLRQLFGAEFDAYRASTPAFFPSMAHVRTGGISDVPKKRLVKTALDGSVFFLFIPLAYIVDRLQESGIIHVFLKVP